MLTMSRNNYMSSLATSLPCSSGNRTENVKYFVDQIIALAALEK